MLPWVNYTNKAFLHHPIQKLGQFLAIFAVLPIHFAEPEITVHGCPDRMSDQIQNCSDVLKYGQTLLQCIQIRSQFHFTNDKIVKYVMKPKAH